jgi:protein-disulfide isomerase
MKNFLISFIAASLLFFSLSAWSASTKQEVIELKAQVAEMQKDLAEIKKLLKEGARAPAARAQQPAFQEQVVSIGTSPFKGKADAPVALVEYSDYQCPYCAKVYRDTMPLIQKEYVDTGKVRYVMRENPLEAIHQNAMNASQAALCAGDQGKYWEMHNQLFDNQRKLSVGDLKTYAGTIGIDTATFNECLDGKKHVETVRQDLASGAKLGVRGTPGFVFGLTDPDDSDKVKMMKLLRGAQPVTSFRATIDELLKSVD